MAKELDDTLSDLFGGSASERKPIAPPAHYTPILERVHNEPCRKCGGSGNFVSYSGRIVGPCFTCKGTGKLTFKTSADHRAKARAQSATRAIAKAADNESTFAAAHPHAMAWLKAKESSFAFAASLLNQVQRYGNLTDRQLAAIERSIANDQSREINRQARIANAPEISAAGIERAFATARANGLKRLRLRLGDFVFTPARETSANAGAIYVKDRNRVYLGKIMGGKLIASRDCNREQQTQIIKLAADPAQSAIAYGKLTTYCACCGAFLENAESVARGIGPICAQKWGF